MNFNFFYIADQCDGVMRMVRSLYAARFFSLFRGNEEKTSQSITLQSKKAYPMVYESLASLFSYSGEITWDIAYSAISIARLGLDPEFSKKNLPIHGQYLALKMMLYVPSFCLRAMDLQYREAKLQDIEMLKDLYAHQHPNQTLSVNDHQASVTYLGTIGRVVSYYIPVITLPILYGAVKLHDGLEAPWKFLRMGLNYHMIFGSVSFDRWNAAQAQEITQHALLQALDLPEDTTSNEIAHHWLAHHSSKLDKNTTLLPITICENSWTKLPQDMAFIYWEGLNLDRFLVDRSPEKTHRPLEFCLPSATFQAWQNHLEQQTDRTALATAFDNLPAREDLVPDVYDGLVALSTAAVEHYWSALDGGIRTLNHFLETIVETMHDDCLIDPIPMVQ